MKNSLTIEQYRKRIAEASIKTAVGCGYNIIESPYLNGLHVKVADPILNMSKCADIFKRTKPSADGLVQAEGSSLLEYAMSFNAKLNMSVNYLLFSADISTEFHYSTSTIEKNSFFKYDAYHYAFREYLSGDIPANALTPAFVRDLREMEELENLFSKYGTHMIKDVFLGGRLNFAFSYMRREGENHTQASLTAEAGYKSIFGAKAEANYNEQAKMMVEKSHVHFSAVGGKIDKSMASLADFHANRNDWLASLGDEDNCMPCGISNMSALIPIWEFCTDPKRAAAIEGKYYELLYRATMKLKTEYRYGIMDIAFVSDTTRYKALSKCPQNYIPIYKNIQGDDDGSFSFLCFKPGLLSNIRVPHIQSILLWPTKERDEIRTIIVDKKAFSAADGFASQNPALQGGSYIYAFYYPYINHDPIDIDVYLGDTQIPPGYLYVEWATGGKANCNEGRSIDPTYVICKRQKNNAAPQANELSAFSICLKRTGMYRVCFYEPNNRKNGMEYVVSSPSKIDDGTIQSIAAEGLVVVTQLLKKTGKWPEQFSARAATFAAHRQN